jgi:hypothetical protein
MEDNFTKSNDRIKNFCYSNIRTKKFIKDMEDARDLHDLSFIWHINKVCLKSFTLDVQKEMIRIKDEFKEKLTAKENNLITSEVA